MSQREESVIKNRLLQSAEPEVPNQRLCEPERGRKGSEEPKRELGSAGTPVKGCPPQLDSLWVCRDLMHKRGTKIQRSQLPGPGAREL